MTRLNSLLQIYLFLVEMLYIYDMIEEIKIYYDELASTYDHNRFGNSYGTYIDSQERAYLKKSLPLLYSSNILDLCCGT